MAGEEIIQRIAISGQDDVIEALTDIGKTGQEAFEGLAKSLGTVGELFAGLIAGATGVGAALGLWAHQASNTTVEMSHLAAQSGTTIETMSAMEGALTSMGASTDALGTAFKRLSVVIETQWAEIEKASRDAHDKQIDNNLAVIGSTLSVQKAQQGLVDAQQKLSEAQGGPKVSPAVEQAQKIQAATLAVEEAQHRVAEAQQKASEAAKKAAEDQRNSIEAISGGVQSVVKGVQTLSSAGETADLTIQNIIKGLVATSNAGPAAGDALSQFSGQIGDLANAEPTVRQVFLQLADFMHNSGDAALNTALAFRLFGRGVSQDVVQAMTQGSAAILAAEENFKRFGLVLTKEDKESAEAFHKTWNELSHDIFVTATQIGNLFGPAFTAGMRNLIEVIQHNHGRIIEFAEGVRDKLAPVIRDFFTLISRSGAPIETPWVKTVVKAFNETIIPAVEYVIKIIKSFFQVLAGEQPELAWVKSVLDGLKAIKDGFVALITSLGDTKGQITAIALVLGTAFGVSLLTGIARALTGAAIAAVIGAAFAPEAIGAVIAAAVIAGLVAVFGPKIAPKIDELFGIKSKDTASKAKTEGQGAPVGATGGGAPVVEKTTEQVEGLGKQAEGAGKALEGFAKRAGSMFEETPKTTGPAGAIDLTPNKTGSLRGEEDLSPGTQRVPPVLGQQPPTAAGRTVAPPEGFENIPAGARPRAPTDADLVAAAARLVPITISKGAGINPETGTAYGRPSVTTSLVPSRGEPGPLAVQDQGRGDRLPGARPTPGPTEGASAAGASPAPALPVTPLFRAFESVAMTVNAAQLAVDKFKEGVTGTASDFKTGLAAADAALVKFAAGIEDALKRASAAATTPSTAQPLAQPAEARAGGGLLRGAGTGTSDSIHVRASSGEYIHRAAAVEHYGVGFMNAINSMSMPRFSLGGLVGGMAGMLVGMTDLSTMRDLPRFAEGGPVTTSGATGGLHPVTINLPSGKSVGGFYGRSSAVTEMHQASVMEQMSSLGPRPSHYR